ncbi:MAG: homocysteine S-methyltransferase family protein [bacterium]
MKGIVELARGRIVVGDGAMGTMLIENGMKVGDCPERWNIARADVVSEIHRCYIEAGSDFIETNTFGANPLKLAKFALENQTEKIISKAVEIAANQSNGKMIAGSIGPTGRILEPYGDLSKKEALDAFKRVAVAMESSGIDFFLIETMADIEEALQAVRAVREVSSRPVVVTMVFSEGPKGYRTMMGSTPVDSAARLIEEGVSIVGTNCCNGPLQAALIIAEMKKVTDLLIAQPNAGLPKVEKGRAVYPVDPAEFAKGMLEVIKAGAKIVGGCCGTTPQHIRELFKITAS